MPSPLGHALGAIAAGWTLSRPPQAQRDLAVQAGILAMLGMAPDLDLLVGRHSQETHSVGAALLAATVAAWRRWPLAGGRGGTWLAAFVAWLTHPLFDALSVDAGPPLGVMFFWPFSSDYWHSGIAIFGATERHWQHEAFVRQNVTSLTWELLILVPLVAIVWWIRKRF
jgi:hypothetical protein